MSIDPVCDIFMRMLAGTGMPTRTTRHYTCFGHNTNTQSHYTHPFDFTLSICQTNRRNQRLAEFDAKRAQRRAEAADEDGDGGGAGGGGDADAERAAMIAGMSLNDGGGDDSDDDDGYAKKERKAKGLEGIIETENSNRAPQRSMKIGDLGSGADQKPMTRKEREEKEKAAKAAAYRKRHEAGLTEEYKHDMAKLAEVKARREVAAAKKAAEAEATKLEEEERKQKVEQAGVWDSGSDSDSDDNKKKKKKKKDSKKSKSGKGGDGGFDGPKLDKITIKKMKPAQLKEALKERGQDIQGNAKALTTRLLDFEAKR